MPVMQVSIILLHIYILFIYWLRQLHETDSKHQISVFKLTTGISNLCKHLFSVHIDQWIRCCDDLRISITSKNALAAVHKFQNEPLETLESEHPGYTREGFVEVLLEFVIDDDLVCAS